VEVIGSRATVRVDLLENFLKRPPILGGIANVPLDARVEGYSTASQIDTHKSIYKSGVYGQKISNPLNLVVVNESVTIAPGRRSRFMAYKHKDFPMRKFVFTDNVALEGLRLGRGVSRNAPTKGEARSPVSLERGVDLIVVAFTYFNNFFWFVATEPKYLEGFQGSAKRCNSAIPLGRRSAIAPTENCPRRKGKFLSLNPIIESRRWQ
jgi:hypothetical protein